MAQMVKTNEERQALPPEKIWHSSPEAFHRLLHWLDGGRDSQGERYEMIRLRLIQYFDRKSCRFPDDLADETLQRVMKWLDENNQIFDEEPAKICFNTARFIFHESLRKKERTAVALEELPVGSEPQINPLRTASLQDEQDERERQLQCLENCTRKLPANDRELIVRYYLGEQRTKLENRKLLAVEFALSANALAIKACRIRNKLHDCVSDCLCQA